MNSSKQLVSHVEDDDCRGHCLIHNVDEEGPAYLDCGECGHRYRTKRELRKAYRRMAWQIYADRPVWRIWRCARIRVSQIYHCPLCAHDF